MGEGKTEDQEAVEMSSVVSIEEGSLSRMYFQFLLVIRKLNIR